MRQSEAGLEARAVIGMIQQELSQAVATTGMTFTATGSSLDFWTLGPVSSSNREPFRVQYSGGLSRNGVQVLEDAVFTVDTSFGPLAASTNLPDWVEVGVELSEESEISSVRVSSQGDADWDADDKRRQALRTWRGEE
jgi:hypothetical protein